MKGNKKVITLLNDLLADELTAINQYMVHAEMCDDWGYNRMHEAIEKRAIVEMKHAEKLIGRIIFLQGTPTVSKLNKINIGKDVPLQFENDLVAEQMAIDAYNKAIAQCGDLGDNGTADLFQEILNDEEDHIDWIETQLAQIKQMGLPAYLAEQVS
ncbi:MAG: bacterioferritin [bacterium]